MNSFCKDCLLVAKNCQKYNKDDKLSCIYKWGKKLEEVIYDSLSIYGVSQFLNPASKYLPRHNLIVKEKPTKSKNDCLDKGIKLQLKKKNLHNSKSIKELEFSSSNKGNTSKEMKEKKNDSRTKSQTKKSQTKNIYNSNKVEQKQYCINTKRTDNKINLMNIDNMIKKEYCRKLNGKRPLNDQFNLPNDSTMNSINYHDKPKKDNKRICKEFSIQFSPPLSENNCYISRKRKMFNSVKKNKGKRKNKLTLSKNGKSNNSNTEQKMNYKIDIIFNPDENYNSDESDGYFSKSYYEDSIKLSETSNSNELISLNTKEDFEDIFSVSNLGKISETNDNDL